MANILVIRLSAIGDVAMTIPVLYNAAKSNPKDSFTVLTQSFLIPIFINRPENVKLIGINTKGPEKSLKGLLRFGSALVQYDYDLVLDLHDVIRTKILCSLFRMKRTKVVVYKKDRRARALLTARKHKVFKPLEPVIKRYSDVFRKAGLSYTEDFTSLYPDKTSDLSFLGSAVAEKKGKWIGIAPFAKHAGKIYPLELQEQVIAHFAANPKVKVFLFGGGKSEQDVFDAWIAKYPSVVSMIGKLNIRTELNLMSHLDVMLSMDSANMHLASLVNIPVVSIWGATHPYAGFMGWKQLPVNTVQLDLSCRPCSVYGQKPCWRGDYACLRDIKPEQVIAKIEGFVD